MHLKHRQPGFKAVLCLNVNRLNGDDVMLLMFLCDNDHRCLGMGSSQAIANVYQGKDCYDAYNSLD